MIEIILHLILIQHPVGLTKPQLMDHVRFANATLEPQGIRLRVKRFRTIRDPFPSLDSLDDRNQKYLALRLRGIRRGWIRPSRWITHFWVPPLMGEEGWYLYGFASGTCALRRWPSSLSVHETHNSLGLDRIPHSLLASNHEWFHLLGAKHLSETPNLMHPDAMSHLPLFLLVHPRTLSQITDCVR